MTIMLIIPSAPNGRLPFHSIITSLMTEVIKIESMRRRVMKRGEEEKEPPPAGSVPLKLCPPLPWSTGSRTGSPAAGP